MKQTLNIQPTISKSKIEKPLDESTIMVFRQLSVPLGKSPIFALVEVNQANIEAWSFYTLSLVVNDNLKTFWGRRQSHVS